MINRNENYTTAEEVIDTDGSVVV